MFRGFGFIFCSCFSVFVFFFWFFGFLLLLFLFCRKRDTSSFEPSCFPRFLNDVGEKNPLRILKKKQPVYYIPKNHVSSHVLQ